MPVIIPRRRMIGPAAPYVAIPTVLGGGTGVAPTLDSAVNLDGTASNSTTITNQFESNGVTTSLSNDIVVVLLAAENIDATGFAPQASGVSGASLGAFTLRRRTTHHASVRGNDYLDLEIWWKLAAAPVTNEVITGTFSSTFDGCVMQSFAVHGCNLSSPWDPNASLTTNQQSDIDQNTIPFVPNVSITNSGTFVIQFVGMTTNAGGGYCHSVSPWTELNHNSGQNVDKAFLDVQVRGFTSPQSNVTMAFDNLDTGTFFGEWTSIVDALTS